MGRPLKSGLDYFPLDVNIDDELALLEAEHGLVGFAIVIKLWQKIYRNGYYIEWDDDRLLLFSKKINSEKTLVSSVINTCLHRNLFNKKMYDAYGILTSKGIQERYFLVCKSSKRKAIKVNQEFTLINPEEIGINPEFTEFTQGESTQRKGKERKGNESTYSSDSAEIRLSELLLAYMKKNNPKVKQPNLQTWAGYINKMLNIDKRTPEEIESVIRWCQNDSFWRSNILSTNKLRDKYDQLYIKMNSSKPNIKTLQCTGCGKQIEYHTNGMCDECYKKSLGAR